MMGGNWIFTCKRVKLDSHITSLKKLNLNWIKDLNVRSKAIKVLDENIGNTP